MLDRVDVLLTLEFSSSWSMPFTITEIGPKFHVKCIALHVLKYRPLSLAMMDLNSSLNIHI